MFVKIYTLDKMLRIVCVICSNEFAVRPYRKNAKFCSQKCYGISIKGKIPKSAFKKGCRVSPETEFKKGEKHKYFGRSSPAKGKHWRLTIKTRRLMSAVRKGKPHPHIGVSQHKLRGDKNWRWIKDRTLLKDDHKNRGGQLHREWSKRVKSRDKWKCCLADENCNGKIIAHHILGWTNYPKLRYEISNGITICHYHHPKKRIEEKRLAPLFQKIISLETTR